MVDTKEPVDEVVMEGVRDRSISIASLRAEDCDETEIADDIEHSMSSQDDSRDSPSPSPLSPFDFAPRPPAKDVDAVFLIFFLG